MAQTVHNAVATSGVITAVELTATPTRIEVRGTFAEGTVVVLTGGNDVTNVQPLTGPLGEPVRISAARTFEISSFVSGDFIGMIISKGNGAHAITVEAI